MILDKILVDSMEEASGTAMREIEERNNEN